MNRRALLLGLLGALVMPAPSSAKLPRAPRWRRKTVRVRVLDPEMFDRVARATEAWDIGAVAFQVTSNPGSSRKPRRGEIVVFIDPALDKRGDTTGWNTRKLDDGEIVSSKIGLWVDCLDTTIIHELGHALGLYHTECYQSIMQSTAAWNVSAPNVFDLALLAEKYQVPGYGDPEDFACPGALKNRGRRGRED